LFGKNKVPAYVGGGTSVTLLVTDVFTESENPYADDQNFCSALHTGISL